MRKFITSIALLAAAPAAAQASPDQPALDRIVAGHVAGEPRACIPLRPGTHSRVVAKTAIIYREGGTLYVNRPLSGAEWLNGDSILVTRPTTSQLCRNEPVRLVDPVTRIERGFVTLGEFTPYKRDKAR